MSAAFGHIKHLYEDTSLTFRNIFDICDSIVDDEQTLYEKFDGQNLMITVFNDQLCGARNKTQLMNPVPIMSIPEMFNKHPHVKESFKIATDTLFYSFQKIPIEYLNFFFCNGSRWINLEILNNVSKNVFNYGDPKIVFNNLCQVQNGKIFGYSVNDVLGFHSMFAEVFNVQKIYPPQPIKINRATGVISSFRAVYTTVKDYDMDLHSFYESIKPGYKLIPESFMQDVITEYGSKLFSNISSKLGDRTLIENSLRNDLTTSLTEISKRPELREKAKPFINRILRAGGLKQLPLLEGVVFYKDRNIYKLTGLFAPINRILGILHYSK